jgi:hypothetical protein
MAEIIGYVLPWFALDPLELAKAVGAYDLPGGAAAFFAHILLHYNGRVPVTIGLRMVCVVSG